MAQKYYGSPGRFWPESKINGLGFEQEAARQAPYGRGAIYFANLNAALLAKSNGQRGLGAFLRPLFERRETGSPITQEGFGAAVRSQLGAQAARDFRAQVIEATQIIVPRPDIFGPCYAVRPIKMITSGKSVVDSYAFEETTASGCPAHGLVQQ